MHEEPLVDAAGRIADGHPLDWPSITSTLSTDSDREIADELALLARIAVGHRALHELLPQPHPAPGDTLADRARWGHLELLNVVGRGSYGTVYRAWDTRLERLVALKLFHEAPHPEAVMREGRMLARVRHEHVVTVYGADVIDGVAGIWMELVHGQTLDEIVRLDGPLDARDAAAIGLDVTRALNAIHGAHLLHCDVKAQNVVRESSGRVVLMDMGAGRPMPGGDDDDPQVAGTPRYMPPELFEADARPTAATDAYGVGVLLYYLTSGRFPVEGASYAELKQAHRAARTTPLAEARPGLPAAFTAIVSEMLQADPAARPASLAEIEHALAPLAAPAGGRSVPWKALAVAAALLIVVAIAWRLTAGSAPATAGAVRSIAVLPIRNLTGDAAKGYVADGLTEVLISNLARIRSVQVPSFAAVAAFRDAAPPAEVARRLGTQYLIAGSIMQADAQFRMTVQLIDPSTGVAIWGDEIVREGPGMISAQAEIARLVAVRLSLDLSEAETRGLQQRPIDLRAQDAFLRGMALRTASPTGRRESSRLFREAIDIEPEFAAAFAELALVEVPLATETANADRAGRAAIARRLARRALQIDPTLAAGHAALGTVQFYEDWDFAAAEETFRHALVIAPSAGFVRQRLSMLLASRNRLPEAIAMAQESVRVEPSIPGRAIALGGVYYYARDYARADAEAERALRLAPDFPAAHFLRGQIAAARGRYGEAITHVQRATALSDYIGWQIELVRIYTAAGRGADAQELLGALARRQQAGEAFGADNLAYIAAADGRPDDAFRILDAAVRAHGVNVLWLAVDPRVDSLRTDARFARLLTGLGLRP